LLNLHAFNKYRNKKHKTINEYNSSKGSQMFQHIKNWHLFIDSHQLPSLMIQNFQPIRTHLSQFFNEGNYIN